MTALPADLRPRLAVRVGVVGHRDVDERDPRIGAAVDACLGLLRDEVAGLAGDPEAARAYTERASDEGPFDLVLLGGFAEGAERLAARRAVRFGARIYAALPVPFDNFSAAAAALDPLLSRADIFELDGDPANAEAHNQNLRAAGHYVVHNCDLLIAIWDGETAYGSGEVGALAEYAARFGLRVWWIHALDDRPARLIGGLGEFRDPIHAPEGRMAAVALAGHLRRLLLPPAANPPERGGVLGLLGAAVRTFLKPDWPPLDEFFAESPRPQRAIWSAYSEFLHLVAPDPGLAVVAEPAPPGIWTDLCRIAERLSDDYGDRYRSSCVLVAGLGVVALTSAEFGGESDPVLQWAFVAIALLTLLVACVLVVLNTAWRWRERSEQYRLLAELARKQRALAPIGWSPPCARFEVGETAEARRDAWIAWLFRAHRRAAPPPIGSLAATKRDALDAGLAMIDRDLVHHETRLRRSSQADARVRLIAEIFLLATLALVLAKFGLIRFGVFDEVHQVVFWTAAAASVAVAAYSVRSFGEFARRARDSRHAISALRAARGELLALRTGPIELPHGSQGLSQALSAAALAALQDVPGWTHLFGAGAPEPG